MLKIIYKIIRSPKTTLAIILLLSAVFFVVMKQNSRMETDLDDYMPQEHPAFVYSNQAAEWFNIQDGVIIAIENDKGVYRSATLQKIKDLTGELQKMAE